MTEIYYKKLNIKINRKDVCLNILEYLKKYKNDKSYVESLNAWSLLKDVLKKKGIKLSSLEIKISDNGKPYIDAPIKFNISHDGNMVVVAVSDNEVGVDIERIKRIKKNHTQGFYNRVLNENEKKQMLETNYPDNELTKIWTLKEAYYKYIGCGIMMNELSKVEDYLNNDSIIVNDGYEDYYISVVVPKKDKIEFIKM